MTVKDTIKRLLSYLGRYKKVLVSSILFTLLVTMIQISTPVVLRQIFNHLQVALGNSEAVNTDYILRLGTILILLYIFLAVFDIIKERSLVYLSQTLTRDMREDVSEKIEKIPLSYFDNHSTGDLIS